MRLYRQLHSDDPGLTRGLDADVFARIEGTSGLTIFVLEHDGAVVASTYLNVIPTLTRSASPYAVIENVIVDNSSRNRGLGKQIMAATLHAAWKAGCYKAMLMTGSSHASTHAFYRACGFDPDEKTGYIARPS
jgi:GNAT superfamily N-acetyltransferase